MTTVLVLLTQGARPRALATLTAAADTIREATGHTPDPTTVRFLGYDHTAAPIDTPAGARCALYEG